MDKTDEDFAACMNIADALSWDSLAEQKTQIPTPKRPAIYAVSDVHSEFYAGNVDHLLSLLPQVTAKYCVLAGDIGSVMQQPDLLRKVFQFFVKRHQHVVFVPGNHEYYGSKFKFTEVNEQLAVICAEEHVHLLCRSVIELDGVLFIGATLWSAIDDAGFNGINDSNHVFSHKVEYLEAFVRDYQFIKESLLKSLDLDMPVVVVTHHLPSKRLIHIRYRDYPINTAFYTNLVDMLPFHKVNYWFCGHTHEFTKVKILDTVFVCNPMGYPQELRYTKLSTETYEL